MQYFIEAIGAAPCIEAIPLDLSVTGGVCCLVGGDESLTIDFLRMMAGVIPARQGVIKVLGSTPQDEPCGGMELRRRVGYVTPRAPLLSVLNGMRNVMLPALYHEIAPERQVTERCQALLDEMGYAGDHHLLPAFMPELQRRMLLIARALILEPELLFIEQPFAGLDRATADRLRDYICGVVARRVKALVIASNDPLLAKEAAQLIYISQKGHGAFAGWQELIASRDSDVQKFLEQEYRFCSLLQG